MKHNSTVSRLVIDGNVVGQQGSQIIAQTAASSIVDNLIISTVNCDFKAASVNSKFNLLGKYKWIDWCMNECMNEWFEGF